MANCLDKILCDNSTKCNVAITDENGNEIETRYLHDGGTIYLYAPERTGHTFNGFAYRPNDGSSPYPITVQDEGDGRYSTTVICGGTYIANYSVNFYTLTVIPDSETHGTTSGSGRYGYNTDVTISATEKEHYHFVGWYIDNILISTDITYVYTVRGDTEIVAKFEADEYSIVGKPENRLLGSVSGSGVYTYGTTATLTATSFPGAYFVEWVDSNGDTNPNKTITVTKNEVWVARFAKNKCKVTIRIVNNSLDRQSEIPGIVTGDGEYAEGSVVQICASPNVGFSLVSLDNGMTVETNSNCLTFTVIGDTEVVVTFDDAMYKLTLLTLPRDGGYITTTTSPTTIFNGGTFPYGFQISVKAWSYSGYTFDGWDDLERNEVHSFTMTHDITATALFKKNKGKVRLTVKFNSSKGMVRILKGNIDVGVYGNNEVYADVMPGTTRLRVIVNGINGYDFIEWDDMPGNPQTPRDFIMINNITREVFFSDNPDREICLCDDFTPDNNLRIKKEGEPDSAYVYFTTNERCFSYKHGTVVIINYTDSEHFKEWDKSGLGSMVTQEYQDGNGYPCLKVTLTEDGEFCVKEKIMHTICYCGKWQQWCASQLELFMKKVGDTEIKHFYETSCYEYEEGTELTIYNIKSGSCFDSWDITDLTAKGVPYQTDEDENYYYLRVTLTDDVEFCVNCKEMNQICACSDWDFTNGPITYSVEVAPGVILDQDLTHEVLCNDQFISGCGEVEVTVFCNYATQPYVRNWIVKDSNGVDVSFRMDSNYRCIFRLQGKVTVCPILDTQQ